MTERTLARGVVALSVAALVGTLFWFWGELNWKNLGGRTGIVAVGLAGAGLGALFAYRMASRPTPIDWIHELVRTAMLATFVSGAGALVAYLGDFEPTGGGLFSLTNNLPNVSTPAFTALMVGATIVATSSVLPIWRHRHAVRTAGDRPLAETLAACGAWLGAAVFVLGLTGVGMGIELVRSLVGQATLAVGLIVASWLVSLRRKSQRVDRASVVIAVSGGLFGVATLAAGLTGFPLPGRDAHRRASACLASGQRGLFREAHAEPVTAYRAPGIEMVRLDCRTTRLYNDERLVVVLGREAGGRDLRGAELFVRVLGAPLERARAACEILLSEGCEAPLSAPGELAGFADVPANENVVPHESAGRLHFFAVTREYPNGRATTIGSRRVLVPRVIELATGQVIEAH